MRARGAFAPFYASVAVAVGLLCGAGAVASCGAGDDTASVAPSHDAGALDSTTDGPSADGAADEASGHGPEAGTGEAGVAAALFSSAIVDVGSVGCRSTGTSTLMVTNKGTGQLAVTATLTGSAFSVSPSALSLDPAATGALTITATVPGSSTAGTALVGSLTLFTNDPTQPIVSTPLTVTPTGATVSVSPAQAVFPTTPPGTPATGIPFSFVNTGNAPATLSLGVPSDPQFSLSGSSADGGVAMPVNPGLGTPVVATAGFTPKATTALTASASSTVTITGPTCGTNVSTLSFTGAVGRGQIVGWPTPPTGQQTAQIDFGPADCGSGAAPPAQFIILTNTGSADAHVTTATITGAPGFSTDALGATIPRGEALTITLRAPPVASPSPLAPVGATLSLETDVDTAPHAIALTEEPRGAVLGFDTSPTAGFGSFGRVVLLQAASQNFNVTNKGNGPATVTLVTTGTGAGPSPFAASNATFTVGANGSQADAATFSPTAAGMTTGTIAMTATGALCSALPQPVPLSGFAVGGGPSVGPTSIAFAASCGGAAPAAQTFSVSNHGDANLNWAMSAPSGPGAASYAVSANPPPGLLPPGGTAIVTVNASAIASPAPAPGVAAYAAQIAVTTDVPFDAPHVVSLGETPLGDQLSLSVAQLRFGQFPIDTTTVGQPFTVTNNANAGSPAASVSFATQGTGAGAYAVSPAGIANLGGGGATSGNEVVTFGPTSATPYPATLAVTTTDSLCTPLPSPIVLTGTGTQGKVSVSASTLSFGTDPSDAKGLVNCGATGPAQTFTVTNTGNQAFSITGLTLGLGAASPYAVTGVTLPALVAIGGTATLTVTPKAIPSAVANPDDPSPFTDTLTVSTDAALDAPHAIALVMQARGAVISNTPLTTSWDFGTLGNGLIGTFTSTITNTGNAAASVSFQGLQHPTVFGLQSDPTVIAANGVTDVVGQFSPPQADQVWTDQGTLVVTAAQVFCEPLPASWTSPTIALSGSSIAGSLPVTVVGSLAFPSTSCGSAAPAAQSVTLTNTTNIAYVFTAKLASGAFYTLQNPSTGDAAAAGILPGNGVLVLGVTPQTVTPGPNVVAGSAPYADDLIVSFQTQPPSGVTIPISWTLDGAMLTLPQGLGPNKDAMGNAFYAADSQSGLLLPMANQGTGTASVQFGAQPAAAFSFSPAPPIAVEPNIEALPRLVSTASDATCPALTSGSVTFLYSGPVCRPFQFPQVSVQSCVGTF